MTALDVLRRSIGDPVRFGPLQERVEILFDEQTRTWTAGASGWLVIPIDRTPRGFYLVSEDREGQRRGREVLRAFLGPTASIQSVHVAPNRQAVDRDLQAAGFTHLSVVERRTVSTEQMLAALEDLVAAANSRDANSRSIRPSHVHLLRDFRLGLRLHDGKQAEQALEDLSLTGRLSAENLRFLTVEMLGSLERWAELRNLPYLSELLRARRPRAVNEIILEMVWQTEVLDLHTAGGTPLAIYEQAELGPRYGAVLNAIDVPSSRAGRAVAAIVAAALGDDDRLRRLVSAARDDAELARLTLIAGHRVDQATGAPDIRELFDIGQYEPVIQSFLGSPEPSTGDLAVQAVLECEDTVHAAAVLNAVQKFMDDALIKPDRRLRHDLAELARFVDGTCDSWVQWCERVGRNQTWADAAHVLRSSHERWHDLSTLSPTQIAAAAENLLNASMGINEDQVVTALDLLCYAASTSTAHAPDFCDAVLMILAEQQNLSAPVRDAYLALFEQILASGPSAARYVTALKHARDLWHRIRAAVTIDWAIAMVDCLLIEPTPEPDVQLGLINDILEKARTYGQRLSLRQRSEVEALAEEAGLVSNRTQTPSTGADIIWHRLNGTVVGIYSLLSGAAQSFEKRLSLLCSPRAVEGNADHVSTNALLSLAQRADHLIVDTHHATHAATNAIDTVRPRDRQILPRGRGVSSFLQALEQALASEGSIR